MADREYKINLTIASDASGAAPVDAGLKRVTDGAKQAEQALKGVEEQSKQTEQAVRAASGSGSSGLGGGIGQNGLPLPSKVRSWHTPEEAAAIERMAGGMRTVTAEAGAMGAATGRAAASAGALAGGTVALGTALAAVAVPLFGAKKEFSEFGAALLDIAARFARASSEGVELPKLINRATQAIKEFSGAAAEERGEEQKLMNAKLDTALARQKATNSARDEKAAIEEVTEAIAEQIAMVEKRNRRLAEVSKTDAAVEDAGFENERARLLNSPGLTREERAAKEADIDRRELEARQARRKADLERERAAENAKLEEADKVVADAEKKGVPAGIEKARSQRDAIYSAVHDTLLRIRGDQARLERVGSLERDSLEERSQANIRSAREADSQEMADEVDRDVAEWSSSQRDIKRWNEQQKKKGSQSDLERLRDNVLGGMGSLRGRLNQGPASNARDQTMDLVKDVERAARDLEQGGATRGEMDAFNQTLQRLANQLSRLSPSLSASMKAFRSELEPRLMRIEEEIGSLNAGSTR